MRTEERCLHWLSDWLCQVYFVTVLTNYFALLYKWFADTKSNYQHLAVFVYKKIPTPFFKYWWYWSVNLQGCCGVWCWWWQVRSLWWRHSICIASLVWNMQTAWKFISYFKVTTIFYRNTSSFETIFNVQDILKLYCKWFSYWLILKYSFET